MPDKTQSHSINRRQIRAVLACTQLNQHWASNVTYESKHIKWAFLYFRALYHNADYKKYCEAKRSAKRSQALSLQKKYQHILTIYRFWGDLFTLSKSKDMEVQFGRWFDKYGGRLEPVKFNDVKVVNSGETIEPVEGRVYFTIPKKASSAFARELSIELLEDAVQRINKKVEPLLIKLARGNWDSTKSLNTTSQRLDVYEWRRVQAPKKSIRKSIFAAYESDQPYWSEHKKKLEQLAAANGRSSVSKLKNDDMPAPIANFAKHERLGKVIISNVLHLRFPKST
jgi:hypothetical protein